MKKNKNTVTKQSSKIDLESFMAKIEGQLLALSHKIDALLNGQVPVKPAEVREPQKPLQQASATFSPAGAPQGQRPNRRERILHKAVCADCKKDCEIPFKPTGERPVYCKECFSKRKSGPKPAPQNQPSQRPAPQAGIAPAPQVMTSPEVKAAPAVQRHVTVTKKGVGKVTVSEVIAPSRPAPQPRQSSKPPREAAPSKRGSKPSSRSRR